jgi:hypothetical protein
LPVVSSEFNKRGDYIQTGPENSILTKRDRKQLNIFKGKYIEEC